MNRALCACFVASLSAVSFPAVAWCQVQPDFWNRLALKDDAPVILSIKYVDAATRNRVVAKSSGAADLSFINRIIVKIGRDAALSLQDDTGIKDVELLGPRTADRTFHLLLELYRVYLYQVSNRFNISAVNFSQGIRYWDRNSDQRGERTIAEALEVLSSRIAPVMVAVGDGAELGVGNWAMAPSAFPVVATVAGGQSILPVSARPDAKAPWRTILYADGAPSTGTNEAGADTACGAGAHLTADQMLRPEAAFIPQPGGSSFSTFKATWNVCFIHQFTEILRVESRAQTPIGMVQVEPFIAYYVDSPVNRTCSATRNRWADVRFQVEPPSYSIKAEDKIRFDKFVSGHSIELRPNYSISLLRAFLSHLPPVTMTDSGRQERYVSSGAVLKMLRDFQFKDLIEIAANRQNMRFSDWKKYAEQDTAPILRPELMDAIESYCRNQSLFLALSDEADVFFVKQPDARCR